MMEKLTIWNYRNPPSETALNSVYPGLLGEQYCTWCQGLSTHSPYLCKRCDRIQLIRECLGEFFGMFIMMAVGTGATAQYVLSGFAAGFYVGQVLAWGIATTFGIYIAIGLSGAHLNPAVTIALSLFRNFPKRRILPYIIAQFFGCYFAGLLIFGEYKEAIYSYESNIYFGIQDPAKTNGRLSSKTAFIFLVYPNNYLSLSGFIGDQIIGAGLQTAGLAALFDARNSILHPPGLIGPLLSGLWISTIIFAFGGNSFFPFNPARNYGMQLAAASVGYGKWIFYDTEWTFLLFPAIGACLGYFFYDLIISIHHTPLTPYQWTLKYQYQRNNNNNNNNNNNRLMIGGGGNNNSSSVSTPSEGIPLTEIAVANNNNIINTTTNNNNNNNSNGNHRHSNNSSTGSNSTNRNNNHNNININSQHDRGRTISVGAVNPLHSGTSPLLKPAADYQLQYSNNYNENGTYTTPPAYK